MKLCTSSGLKPHQIMQRSTSRNNQSKHKILNSTTSDMITNKKTEVRTEDVDDNESSGQEVNKTADDGDII